MTDYSVNYARILARAICCINRRHKQDDTYRFTDWDREILDTCESALKGMSRLVNDTLNLHIDTVNCHLPVPESRIDHSWNDD